MTQQEFHAKGWFEIAGRGWVAAVKNPGGYPEPNVLRGERVLIDGAEYLVLGVESYRIGRPYPDTLDFALLIEGERRGP